MFILIFVPLLIIAIIKSLLTRKEVKSICGKHVVVTGGSSGIGLWVAILSARQGANVTIIARDFERLAKAKEIIEQNCLNDSQIIYTISIELSNKKAVNNVFTKLEQKFGPIYMLVNCAGMAICGRVEEFNEQDVATLFNANYYSTLYPVQYVVPKFKERKEGIIVMTASQVALMGMYGYSIYSSCKFALRGLAESVAMEVKPYNVSVTLSLPPDTDTPGFKLENKTKPLETTLISNTAGLFKPESVAAKLLKDAMVGRFMSFVGLDSFILSTLCVGMSPYTNFLEVMYQTILMGPIRLIGAYYVRYFDRIVTRCHKQKRE